MRHVARWVVLLAFPWTALAQTGEAPGPSETELLQAWLQHGQEVASWREQIGAARFDVVTAGLLPNPQIGLSGSVVVAGQDHPPDGLYNWGPQLMMPLPIFGQVGARQGAAASALRVTEVAVAAALWQRAAELQGAMRDRAFADARAHLVERNLAELTRLQGIVTGRVAAGANARYDVLRVATALATMQADLAGATVERDRAEGRLVSLIAAPEITSAPITLTGLAPFAGSEDEAALLRSAFERRPDLELARRGRTAAEMTAERGRMEVIPTPNLMVGTYFTHDFPSASIIAGLSVTLPVFDQNQGVIGHAMADADGQRELAEGLEARIRAEVRTAWQAREVTRRALEEFRQASSAVTDELLQRAEVAYQAGGTFLIMDLLDAYRTVWEARAQELALQRAFADAEIELERAAALVVSATDQ